MAKIVVAGATGDLGGRIVSALLERDADVVALVRPTTTDEARKALATRGVKVTEVTYASAPEIARACAGASCVVSALQGNRDVIFDAQGVLADGVLASGVTRFIPSDFSIDFNKIPDGSNRNLDLRRAFHRRIDQLKLSITTIFNGAFAELLTTRMPLLNIAEKRVSYWGSADQKLDFTTLNDTAAFTASVALDETTPRFMRIVGDQFSARELAAFASTALKTPFELVSMGTLDGLAALIDADRRNDPASEQAVFPKWQGLQYMHNMFSGKGKLYHLDNERYPIGPFVRARDLITVKPKRG